MLVLVVRGLIRRALLGSVLCIGACGPTVDEAPADDLQAYVDSAAYRAAALEESLVNPSNAYSRLRLEHYADWSALPAYNPPSRPFTTEDLGRFVASPRTVSEPAGVPLDLDVPLTLEGLAALGALAFERYPVQIDTGIVEGTVDAETAVRLGLWIDDRGHVGGLLRVALPDGAEGTGISCATCHATTNERGALVPGLANALFHRSGISAVGAVRRGEAPSDRGWPPGRLDVTPDQTDNPVAIGDLRAVRHQTHLHWAGTVRNGLIPLALRIETLIITSNSQGVRPPHIVPLAIAAYLWTLPDPAPIEADADPRGAELFGTACASCHGDGRSPGPPVPLDDVGTDDAAGRTSSRATGAWRVPTLVGVGTRTQLLHTGEVNDLAELFAPDRPARVPGHAFGTDLSADDRAALVAYLRSL